MNELEKAAREFQEKEFSFFSGKGMAVDLHHAFASGAEWKAKQSQWISVEERLPEKDGLRVWVKSSCHNEQPLVYYKGKFYARLSDGCYDGSVTHWMPIPE